MSIERLTAEDQLMLRGDEIWPQDIGALALLDGRNLFDPAGRFRIEAARAAVQSRLHLVPRFRQLIYAPRRGLGGPAWVDAPHFYLSEHVRVLPLATPASEAELLLATERLRRQRLDASRPLWEMWFMTGLPERRIGLYVRMHHALADGMAAMTTVGAFLDSVPDATIAQAQPWTPAPLPPARELLADNLLRHLKAIPAALEPVARPRGTLRQMLAALPATRELLAGEPAQKTSLDRMVGPGRNLALVRSSIDLVKEIAHSYDATVNDVLLAVTAGGLRGLLRSRGERVEDLTVRIYVPVSLRRWQRGALKGNLISQMVVPLRLGVSDPGLRLQQIAAETAKRKARSRTSLGAMFRSRIASRLMLKAIIRQRVNVESANLPGPERPLYFAGARLIEVFPLLNLIGNVALGVGALSYAGTYNIGVVADQDAYPDIDVLAASVRAELNALAASTGGTSVDCHHARAVT
ncbi:MAG TPA: wax ester/triacylglycerol synthase domain-containing protein [Rubrobacter sp.]|nr:wax ester/triacylglycerol synthase domain-containing protein [Rubrobacter sp.]